MTAAASQCQEQTFKLSFPFGNTYIYVAFSVDHKSIAHLLSLEFRYQSWQKHPLAMKNEAAAS